MNMKSMAIVYVKNGLKFNPYAAENGLKFNPYAAENVLKFNPYAAENGLYEVVHGYMRKYYYGSKLMKFKGARYDFQS